MVSINEIIVEVLAKCEDKMKEDDENVCADALEKIIMMMKTDEEFFNRVKDFVRPNK